MSDNWNKLQSDDNSNDKEIRILKRVINDPDGVYVLVYTPPEGPVNVFVVLLYLTSVKSPLCVPEFVVDTLYNGCLLKIIFK